MLSSLHGAIMNKNPLGVIRKFSDSSGHPLAPGTRAPPPGPCGIICERMLCMKLVLATAFIGVGVFLIVRTIVLPNEDTPGHGEIPEVVWATCGGIGLVIGLTVLYFLILNLKQACHQLRALRRDAETGASDSATKGNTGGHNVTNKQSGAIAKTGDNQRSNAQQTKQQQQQPRQQQQPQQQLQLQQQPKRTRSPLPESSNGNKQLSPPSASCLGTETKPPGLVREKTAAEKLESYGTHSV